MTVGIGIYTRTVGSTEGNRHMCISGLEDTGSLSGQRIVRNNEFIVQGNSFSQCGRAFEEKVISISNCRGRKVEWAVGKLSNVTAEKMI